MPRRQWPKHLVPKAEKPIENSLDASHNKTCYVELRKMKVTYPKNYIKPKYDIFQTTWDLGLIPPPSFWSVTVMVMMVVLRCLVGGHFSEKSLKQRIDIFVSKSFFYLMCPIFASINPFFEYFVFVVFCESIFWRCTAVNYSWRTQLALLMRRKEIHSRLLADSHNSCWFLLYSQTRTHAVEKTTLITTCISRRTTVMSVRNVD